MLAKSQLHIKAYVLTFMEGVSSFFFLSCVLDKQAATSRERYRYCSVSENRNLLHRRNCKWIKSTSLVPEVFYSLNVALRAPCTTLVLDWTCSLQMRHFLTRGEHSEQVAMWPHGPNSVSRFMSEHTIHSSRVSLLLFRDGLREPTCPLRDTERGRDGMRGRRSQAPAGQRGADEGGRQTKDEWGERKT